jgi:hypothetical protein
MKILGALGVTLLAVTACYPGEVTSTSELDLTITVRDTEFDFGAVTTFAMRDTIVQLNEDASDAIDISRDFDADILDKVRANLVALGWTELDAAAIAGGQTPDVGVANLVTASQNTTWWVGGGGGWCWYYPCYPGWGWGWPPYVGASTYSAGTYFLVMLDTESGDVTDPDADFDGVWGAAMDGLLSSTTSNVTRLLEGIDQAFTQSPYLDN